MLLWYLAVQSDEAIRPVSDDTLKVRPEQLVYICPRAVYLPSLSVTNRKFSRLQTSATRQHKLVRCDAMTFKTAVLVRSEVGVGAEGSSVL